MATVASTSARSQPSTSTLPCTFTTETWPPGGRSKRFSQTRSAPYAVRAPALKTRASVRSRAGFKTKVENRKSKLGIHPASFESRISDSESRISNFKSRFSSFEFRFSKFVPSGSLVMIVLIAFLLALLAFLFTLLVAAISFRALLLPGFPVAIFALLQLAQRGVIDFANLDVTRHGPDFQYFSPSIQGSMAPQGGGNQFFLVALNVEREVGSDLAAGRGIDGRIDGERHIGGQVDEHIPHARFKPGGAKSLLCAVELRQNASRRRGSPDGAFEFEQIDAAARGFRHHAAARPLKPDAAARRLRPNASTGGPNLDLPARGLSYHLPRGAAHHDVAPCGLCFQRACHRAGYDFSAAGLENSITFHFAHADGASRCACRQVTADPAEGDTAAGGFNPYGAG